MSVIKDSLSLKGKPAEIPNCGRDDLPEFFKEMGYKVGAEIGVYKGGFTKHFCDAGLKMYGIDPWRAYGNYDKEFGDKGKNLSRFQKRQDFLYDHTKRYLANHIESGLCVLIRKASMDALADFKDGFLDFVYIDGNHGFRYVAEDVVEWSKKVKTGGVVSGHDYALIKKPPRDPYVLHVKYVLHAFTEAFGIKNWYVLGRKNVPGERLIINNRHVYKDGDKEEIRDQWRSWMFIKEKEI